MTVTVVGMDGDALPSDVTERLEKATLVVGGRRHLQAHAREGATTIELGALDAALTALASHSPDDGDAVVLASGDPGFFGVLRALREKGIRPEVRPATSSVQRLAAMIGRPWDDMVVVSAHGRGLRQALNVCRAHPSVAVLTAPGAGPAELGAGLHGWRRTLIVAEDLGGSEEVSTVDAAAAGSRQWRDPNVVFCLAEPDTVPDRGWLSGGEVGPDAAGWAFAEDAFAHRDGMVTKSEVRAVALAKLAPRRGSLVWDVGAGSGAVAVECARFGAAAIAIERDPVQCVRIIANATSYGVDVRVVEAEFLAAISGLPQPDSIFVGGGRIQVLRACTTVGAQRIVVALAAVDRVAPARNTLREAGYQVQGVQLSASRLEDLPDGASRLSSINPVTLLWGVRKPS
ncbi:MAG: precorrin-6y C5,15-methyltransferase (decarboxylating) subunit CbiE [Kutzneria sp.]|nr:precorrin-6y C5,15-methyltransferase (decarboxylating) subunit CbiE [Kutzneria sp.]MBV9845396.1 precorrin-6y C5,15-methyltransferase (decarboxylating) subunit CbiE [Kutzneria sp.]